MVAPQEDVLVSSLYRHDMLFRPTLGSSIVGSGCTIETSVSSILGAMFASFGNEKLFYLFVFT